MPDDFEMFDTSSETGTDRLFGKYRGIVHDNEDPDRLGRLQAIVPEVLGEIPTGWASPCAPYAGTGAGFYAVPPAGAGVWIEFEAGDVSRPIWAGAWWGEAEVPMKPTGVPTKNPQTKILRTETGLIVALDDEKHTITISDALGQNRTVVDVENGAVIVTGLARVVLEAPLILEGSRTAGHPAVLGDRLMTYLDMLVTLFNGHVHPGEMAAGILPVTPAPPVAPMPLPPNLLSLKVKLE